MPPLEPEATVGAAVIQQNAAVATSIAAVLPPINSSMTPAEIVERVFNVRLNAEELKGTLYYFYYLIFFFLSFLSCAF